ncbi:MAG: hypothetical protein E7252_08875, partial [Lachnospira sp.]|nr:hypothetical protein [Lachnospira sp.]
MKKMKTRKIGRRILCFVLTLVLVLGFAPENMMTVSAEGPVVAYDGVPVAPQQITSSNYLTFGLTGSNWEQ